MPKLTPRIRLTNPEFRYVSAVDTDISKRFAKVRRELAKQREQRKATEAADNAVLHANFDARRRAKERA